ncbi:M56 family metallopeptidase [Herbivorax sp. ANBcel31]|uniref:M56 family metallopeptidase n=1 Tax=Herbivorax sp. ANBcel31 TaxID=3069754 RepID=UPI0027B5F7CD|nr:M56 family metallopeptidase [Herbivorax sp. ANBcel31]MDQ2088087.1 M56 family metallopeptidase [Herbivorax sp. ANBcel31]
MVTKVIDTLFYFILNMSIAASVIGVFIILLRFFKIIPRIGIYMLWGLVFLRLVLPFALSSRMSIFNYLGGIVKRVEEVHLKYIAYEPNITPTFSNYVGTAETLFPVVYRETYFKTAFSISSYVWIAGVVVSIIIISILYFFSKIEFDKSIHLRDNIYISNSVQSPMVYGVFKQKIIIPREFKKELKYILLHENIHIKRRDNFLRMLSIFIVCIHWFNALMWLFLMIFLKDMEITCDQKAVRTLSTKQKREYAHVLLNMNTNRNGVIYTAFKSSNTRTRVLNVLNYERLSIIGAGLSVVFVILMIIVFLTNPVIP